MEFLCDVLDDEETVVLSLMYGINVNHKNSDLKTGLHIAAEQGDSLIEIYMKIFFEITKASVVMANFSNR